MKKNQYIILALVALFSFPVMYVAVLLTTGKMKIVFNMPKTPEEKEKQEVSTIKNTVKKDSLQLTQTSTFKAMEQERIGLVSEREKLQAQQERVTLLQNELEKTKEKLSAQRKSLEGLVSTTDTLELKRIRQLSKVYASMRATEAAQILETLDDAMVAKILSGISDDRQKAKILSALTKEKASSVSRKIGM